MEKIRILNTTTNENFYTTVGIPNNCVEIPDDENLYKYENGEIVEDTETLYNNKLSEIRSKRNYLLKESDVYMLSDYPIEDDDKATVESYRQELRDLPASLTEENIDEVEFPALEI